MTEIRAVLFDFAGTLFAPLGAPAWVRLAAARIGLDLDGDELDALAARYLEVGLPGGPYPAAVPDALAARYAERDLHPEAHRAAYVGLLSTVAGPDGLAEAIYEEILRPDVWRPYADTARVLGGLQERRIPMAMISNIGYDPRPILRELGFAALAQRCALSFEHGARKPEPALFAAALDLLGSAPAETLMVGDHPAADGGAADMGMPTLLLPMTAAGSEHGLGLVLALIDARA